MKGGKRLTENNILGTHTRQSSKQRWMMVASSSIRFGVVLEGASPAIPHNTALVIAYPWACMKALPLGARGSVGTVRLMKNV